MNRDVIEFLDGIKASRRAEMTRHILRYYISHLDELQPILLPLTKSVAVMSSTSDTLHELKIRLDPVLDKELILLIERVPRKRRSEFVRHVFHYYLNDLPKGVWYLMPSTTNHFIEEEEEDFDLPGAELSAFKF